MINRPLLQVVVRTEQETRTFASPLDAETWFQSVGGIGTIVYPSAEDYRLCGMPVPPSRVGPHGYGKSKTRKNYKPVKTTSLPELRFYVESYGDRGAIIAGDDMSESAAFDLAESLKSHGASVCVRECQSRQIVPRWYENHVLRDTVVVATPKASADDVKPPETVSQEPKDTILSDDLLDGADAIAQFVFGDAKYRRKIYHLAASGGIPTFNLGAIVCARKSTLLAWIKQQEQESDT